MSQKDYVIEAMQKNGGYATFQQLNQRIDFSSWGTKTPHASVRRIVQTNKEFFRIAAGLWGLSDNREEILRRFINREYEFMSLDEAKKVFNERKMREEKWGMEDVLSQANLILQTDYEKPFELSTAIMEKYNEFVRQQMELESKKIVHEDLLR